MKHLLLLMLLAPLSLCAMEANEFETALTQIAASVTPENKVQRESTPDGHELTLQIPENVSIFYGMGPKAQISEISATHNSKEKKYDASLFYRTGHYLGLTGKEAKAMYKLLKKKYQK